MNRPPQPAERDFLAFGCSRLLPRNQHYDRACKSLSRTTWKIRKPPARPTHQPSTRSTIRG